MDREFSAEYPDHDYTLVDADKAINAFDNIGYYPDEVDLPEVASMRDRIPSREVVAATSRKIMKMTSGSLGGPAKAQTQNVVR